MNYNINLRNIIRTIFYLIGLWILTLAPLNYFKYLEIPDYNQGVDTICGKVLKHETGTRKYKGRRYNTYHLIIQLPDKVISHSAYSSDYYGYKDGDDICFVDNDTYHAPPLLRVLIGFSYYIWIFGGIFLLACLIIWTFSSED